MRGNKKEKEKKKKKNPLLTDHILYVLGDPKILETLKPQERANFYFAQRQKSQDSIEYLTFMLRHLPEKQLEQVFSAEKMKPFFNILFDLEIKAKSGEEYLEIKESKEFKQKRQRLLALSALALGLIGSGDFVYALLPEILKPYITWNAYLPLENFKAILSCSFQDRKDL